MTLLLASVFAAAAADCPTITAEPVRLTRLGGRCPERRGVEAPGGAGRARR